MRGILASTSLGSTKSLASIHSQQQQRQWQHDNNDDIRQHQQKQRRWLQRWMAQKGSLLAQRVLSSLSNDALHDAVALQKQQQQEEDNHASLREPPLLVTQGTVVNDATEDHCT
jgi:hypothetical protein